MTQAGVSRLLWIGGAGSLEVAPGIRLLDTPGFPDAYKSEALAQAEVLAEFRATETTIDWTYFSPALIIAPGERTGKFRIGGNQLLKDASGNSHISTEDFVIALLDEAEKPEHHGERITVAY
jgi:putative NADH-flavin reductase